MADMAEVKRNVSAAGGTNLAVCAGEQPILKVEHVKTYFDVTKGLFSPKQIVKAVDDVSFSVGRGETYGLVGESGCGKSTLGRTLVKIYPATEGKIMYNGQDIAAFRGAEEKNFRKEVQMIFQDPYASLNPRMTVGEIIKEPMEIHGILSSSGEREERAAELLKIVGLKPDHIRRYPHEFSGGQRQRICIARALALNPDFIVCDEPVSALDVSIQAQIINLMKDLQQQRQLTYLFISHDLSVVEHISDVIGVMYLGSMVETGTKDDIFKEPLHPYTKALFSAVPIADPDVKMKRIILEGDIPSPSNPPKGCKFHTRCSQCMAKCKEEVPVPKDMGNGHVVSCHLYD